MSTAASSTDARSKIGNGLPAVSRYVTTHDPSGKAIYSSSLLDACPFMQVSPAAYFGSTYMSKEIPIKLNNEEDVKNYDHALHNPSPEVYSSGMSKDLTPLPSTVF
jgi:hypothetical protein